MERLRLWRLRLEKRKAAERRFFLMPCVPIHTNFHSHSDPPTSSSFCDKDPVHYPDHVILNDDTFRVYWRHRTGKIVHWKTRPFSLLANCDACGRLTSKMGGLKGRMWLYSYSDKASALQVCVRCYNRLRPVYRQEDEVRAVRSLIRKIKQEIKNV